MENKTKGKSHLTLADRNKIQGGLANKKSLKEIAFELHKNPSTISREIKAHMFVKKKEDSTVGILMTVCIEISATCIMFVMILIVLKKAVVIVVSAYTSANLIQSRFVKEEKSLPMFVMGVLK